MLKKVGIGIGIFVSISVCLIFGIVNFRCQLENVDCGKAGKCKNGFYSFECECESGAIHVDDAVSPCYTDYCFKRGCGNGKCIIDASKEMFTCECNQGYRSMNGTQCIDIDECESDSTCGDPNSGNCFNQAGSYSCSCKVGFTNKNGSNSECIVYNACDDIPAEYCGLGHCDNRLNEFVCLCDTGARNENENKTSTCIRDNCYNIDCISGTCRNKEDNFECICDEGFKINNSTECVDIDECEADLCGTDANCINHQGGYQCACKDGFVNQDALDLTSQCIDIDECDKFNWDCGSGACINLFGSFECRCFAGFRNSDNLTSICITDYCKDINCINGECSSNETGYDCICDDGFEKQINNNDVCIDINECDSVSCGDSDEGKCTNMDGTYKCDCEIGYTNQNSSDQGYCIDIDECLDFDCGHNSTCINKNGTHECICHEPGYGNIESSLPCEDIDECNDPYKYLQHHNTSQTEQSYCHFGTCSNTQGGYNCSCPDYFDLKIDDGPNSIKYCIDKCSQNSTLCGNGTCSITVNGLQCDCEDGYESKDPGCENINECELGYCGFGTCSDSVGNFTCTCPAGYLQGKGQHQCRACDTGYEQANEFGACLDVNECNTSEIDCGEGECQNNPGSYSCNCLDGFSNLLSDTNSMCGNYSITVTVKQDRGCSIRPINDTTLVYETPNPYSDNSECSAEFHCRDGQVLEYSIERFEIESHSTCEYDSLVFNGKTYCNEREPRMNGMLSLPPVSDNYVVYNSTRLSWQGAYELCESMPGNFRLPVPLNQTENDFIASYVTFYLSVPLGITDEGQGNWANYYTGEELTFSEFRQGEISRQYAEIQKEKFEYEVIEYFWVDVSPTDVRDYNVVCVNNGLVDKAVSFSSDDGVTMEGFSMTMQCVVDICSNNGSYCGNGTCSYSNHGLECNCEKGFQNKDQNPTLPCQEINECENVDCGQGYCKDEIDSFSCICDEGYYNLWNTTDSPCRQNYFSVVKLGIVRSWSQARDRCSNYNDGSYTLPVPDSAEYHDYLSDLVTDDKSVIPLGFIDNFVKRGPPYIFINVYTNESMIWDQWYPGQPDETVEHYYSIEQLYTQKFKEGDFKIYLHPRGSTCLSCRHRDFWTVGLDLYTSQYTSVICVKQIIKVDICDENPNYCGNGTCSSSIYVRRCNCDKGFVNQNRDLTLPCQDLNECSFYDCGQGDCINHIGSYTCNCFDGFTNLNNDSSLICGNWPDFKVEKTTGCSISMMNDTTLIYETSNPYVDNSECIVNFNCVDSQLLSYSIQRFEIEFHENCDYDYLVLNGNIYCDGTLPELNGLLSNGTVSFTSDGYTGGAGFSMLIQCKVDE